jgi:hypothetical protein
MPRSRVRKILGALIWALSLVVPASVSAAFPTAHWSFAAASTGSINIAVVRLNFESDRRSPGPADVIGDMMFNQPDIDGRSQSLATYFSAASYGRLGVAGTVLPTVTVPKGSGSCDNWRGWGRSALEALEGQGVDLNEFTHATYIWPTLGCDYAGIAEMPGEVSGLNLSRRWWLGAESRRDAMDTMIHEIGHNLGAPHAGAIRCRAGGRSVAGVTANCRAPSAFGRYGGSDTWEYGDNLDVMGGNLYLPFYALPSAPSRFLMGFLTEEEMPLIEEPGSYELELNLLNEFDAAVKGYRIRRPNAEPYGTWGMTTQKTAPEICIDWRERGATFDRFPAGVGRGVSIRLCDVTGVSGRSEHGNAVLVDTTPGSRVGFRDWIDGSLRVGATFVDQVSGIEIELLAIQRDSTDSALSRATLRVTIP